jgi:hypothetical protein
LSVNSLNGTFTFDTYKNFEEVQRVQDRIWQARAELLARATHQALALMPAVPLPPSPVPAPSPPPPTPPVTKADRRSKRR